MPSQISVANASAGEDDPSGNPYLVRLRREVYPVRRKGKVVSFKASYSGVLHIGSPLPQEFRVVFDTGSGHVVLPSVECRSDTCMRHRRYDMGQSQSAVAVNLDGSEHRRFGRGLSDQVTIGFGTGKVVGQFVRDVVCLGPASPSQEGLQSEGQARGPCVNAQVVMAVDMSRRPFELFDFDGILGMGLGSLALSSNFSFFGLLAASKQMTHAHFGVFLADTDSGEESEIAIGGHNPSRLLEPLAWVPMVKPELGYWQVEIMALHINGQKLDVCSGVPCSGILDTGTSHLGIPSGHSEKVYELLTREAGEATDCRRLEGAVVRIELRDFNLTLYPEHYMRKLPLPEDVSVDTTVGVTPTSYQQENYTDPGGGSILRNEARVASAASSGTAGNPSNSSAPKSYCTPKLLPVNLTASVGGNVFILGEPVLHRYYTVYDWKGLRAGFGLASHRGSQRGHELEGVHGTAVKAPQEKREAEVQDDIVLLQVVVVVQPRSGVRRLG